MGPDEQTDGGCRPAEELIEACVAETDEAGLLRASIACLAARVPGERHALIELLDGGRRAQVIALAEEGTHRIHPPAAGFAVETMEGVAEIEAGRSVLLPDLSGARSATERSLLAGELRSSLRIPFPLGGRPAGLLVVGRREAGAFTREEQTLLERAAPALSLVLRGARMLREVEHVERAVEERLLHTDTPVVLVDSLTLEPLHANRALLDLLGCAAEELPARGRLNLLAPQELGAFRRFLHEVRTRGRARGAFRIAPAPGREAQPAMVEGRETLYRGRAAFELALDWASGADPEGQEAPCSALETIAEAVPDILWEMDRDGNYTYVSPALGRVLGYAPETWIGRFPVLGVVEPAEAATVRRLQELVRQGRQSQGVEWRARTIDGWMVWFSTFWAPVRDGRGELVGAAGVHRDISASKLGERRLRRQEELLRTVVGSVDACLLSVLPDGTVEWVNDAAHAAFGPGGEGASCGLYVLGPEGDLPFESVLEGRTAVSLELTACNGRTYAAVAHPVFAPDETPERMILLLLDETERLEREEALRLAERRYRTVADFTYSWEFWLDPGGSARYHSPSCLAESGFRPDELPDLESIVCRAATPEQADALRRHLRDGIGGRSESDIELPWRRPDGREVWLSLSYQGVSDEDGAPLGVRGSFHDCTERRELTARLAEQERYAALGSVAAGVAHHFSNLLSIIQGEAQLAELKPEPRTIPPRLQEIQRCVRQAAEHVRRLREYAGEPFTLDDPDRATRADGLAAQALWQLEMLGVDTAGAGGPVTGEVVRDSTRTARGSHSLVEQALEAVLRNAVEACAAGGSVLVRIADEGEWLVCSVEDSGEGIAPENLDRVLEPFFTTRGPRRAGLGLSSAFGLIARCGGELTIGSRPGGPTVVRIRLRALPEG